LKRKGLPGRSDGFKRIEDGFALLPDHSNYSLTTGSIFEVPLSLLCRADSDFFPHHCLMIFMEKMHGQDKSSFFAQ
jgi:hypothetical protein